MIVLRYPDSMLIIHFRYPIRNCGLLLIRSLFDHIFGTNTGKDEVEKGWDGKSTMINYNQLPALTDLITHLLEMGTDDALILSPVFQKSKLCIKKILQIPITNNVISSSVILRNIAGNASANI
mgnify:CR=1 FL=1